MKRARVAYNGAIHDCEVVDGLVVLADGRRLAEEAVVWLPPVEPRTTIALAINYADHAKELAFKTPEKPLAFIKGPGTYVGHRAVTRKPADAGMMHYECELAVIIGRTCRDVPIDRAYEVVAGYSVANDYAIRNFLENYYRPNLRTKNRDGCTVLGPWMVDAADVPDPMNLDLSTTVNGETVQRGNTRDMVFGVPALIAYLTSFMTLAPGDIILTGTPDGVIDVKPGDRVVTEIQGVGRLINNIVDDQTYFQGAQAG
jgi:5-oxopent-3-ene-1,2,5-tricarboxylate decarboxylase/2-hydroxyhepta-2,4-diene-1,7-dioate isomerase